VSRKSHGPSVQSLMVASAAFWGLLAAFVASSERGATFLVTLALAMSAVAVAFVGWRRAKAVDALTSFIGFWSEADGRFDWSTPETRRSLMRQMMGRELVTAEGAESVRFLILSKRRRTVALLPSLVAMALMFAALVVATEHLAWGAIGMALVVGVMLAATRYEKRREDRVLKRAFEVDTRQV